MFEDGIKLLFFPVIFYQCRRRVPFKISPKRVNTILTFSRDYDAYHFKLYPLLILCMSLSVSLTRARERARTHTQSSYHSIFPQFSFFLFNTRYLFSCFHVHYAGHNLVSGFLHIVHTFICTFHSYCHLFIKFFLLRTLRTSFLLFVLNIVSFESLLSFTLALHWLYLGLYLIRLFQFSRHYNSCTATRPCHVFVLYLFFTLFVDYYGVWGRRVVVFTIVCYDP